MLPINLNTYANDQEAKRLHAKKAAEEAAKNRNKDGLIRRVEEAAEKSLPEILEAAEKDVHGHFYLCQLNAKDKEIYHLWKQTIKQSIRSLFGPKARIALDRHNKLELTWDGRAMSDYSAVEHGKNCCCFWCEGF